MGTAPPIVPGYDMLCASDSIQSPPYIQDNYPRSDKEQNPTIAIIELISSCRPTECVCLPISWVTDIHCTLTRFVRPWAENTLTLIMRATVYDGCLAYNCICSECQLRASSETWRESWKKKEKKSLVKFRHISIDWFETNKLYCALPPDTSPCRLACSWR